MAIKMHLKAILIEYDKTGRFLYRQQTKADKVSSRTLSGVRQMRRKIRLYIAFFGINR